MKMNTRANLIGIESKTTKKGQDYLVGRFSDDIGNSVEVQAWEKKDMEILSQAKKYACYDVALDFQKNGSYTAFNLLGMKHVSA